MNIHRYLNLFIDLLIDLFLWWLWYPCFARVGPPLFFPFNPLFSKALFSPVVPAVVPLCKCASDCFFIS